ncbi:NACHT domain-containing protein [Zoogloea sp.]|uniref:NACHT domain-containing protein n=1 Tax=Zoogloea sp. TaxID=49181 RepID=UPI0035B28EB9
MTLNTDAAMKWQQLERLVRVVAEMKFGGPARAEDIAGVKCDCVIHLNDGSVVIVEITRKYGIDKLRTDINKFNSIRPHFFGRNIFPKCYFITLDEPTPALIATGKENHVHVYSVNQFFNFMLGLQGYVTLRQRQAFGSAIDMYSGEPDEKKYVHVNYFSDSGEAYSTEKITEELEKGKTIVLIGDYGSGKSRCVKEVFAAIAEGQIKRYKYPIAINLRDNWGLKRATELITRHFTDIGLGGHVADILKVAFSPACIYLLDGFDEIGAQTWSDDPTKLVDIRRQSLVGIKDLIQKAKGGVLVTGREHYFNTDAELLTCLGLDAKQVLFLRCNQELSEAQFAELIGRTTPNLPAWIPKKPLIGTIIRDIEASMVDHIFATSTGQIDFWDLLLNTFCEREAKINPILDPSIIRALYSQVGRLSRFTKTSLGPISIKDINEAFEQTTGRPPTDESAIILQRLPGLSRIGAESLDRQFVDTYILDGLKAEDVLSVYSQSDTSVLQVEWKHSLESFGAFYLATRIQSIKQSAAAVAFIKRHIEARNRVLLSDLISSMFLCDGSGTLDFGSIVISKGKFFSLSFADSPVTNLRFDDCTFDNIDITDAAPDEIRINRSVVIHMSGVTSQGHIPKWISGCLVEDFQSVNTLAAIREAGLSTAQTFLLSSLRKLFLQPGAGRRSSSMYKGYGDSATKKTCDKVIALLLREKFCQKYRGVSEELYLPDRSLTGRVKAIMSMMTQSKDPLWIEASRIS